MLTECIVHLVEFITRNLVLKGSEVDQARAVLKQVSLVYFITSLFRQTTHSSHCISPRPCPISPYAHSNRHDCKLYILYICAYVLHTCVGICVCGIPLHTPTPIPCFPLRAFQRPRLKVRHTLYLYVCVCVCYIPMHTPTPMPYLYAYQWSRKKLLTYSRACVVFIGGVVVVPQKVAIGTLAS
jgi:hypothetical protein